MIRSWIWSSGGKPTCFLLLPIGSFVKIGVNDALSRHGDVPHTERVTDERYRATYRRLLRRATSSSARLVLIEPTPLEEDPNSRTHDEVRGLCSIIASVAEEFGVEVCRVFDRFVDNLRRGPQREWLFDLPHPSFRGHAIVALCVLEHIGW